MPDAGPIRGGRGLPLHRGLPWDLQPAALRVRGAPTARGGQGGRLSRWATATPARQAPGPGPGPGAWAGAGCRETWTGPGPETGTGETEGADRANRYHCSAWAC